MSPTLASCGSTAAPEAAATRGDSECGDADPDPPEFECEWAAVPADEVPDEDEEARELLRGRLVS